MSLRGCWRAADAAYRRGAASPALLNQDWAQIAQWQAWAAAASAGSREAARQTPPERASWLRSGAEAARAAGDARAEAACLFRMAWAIHKGAALEAAEQAARAALAQAEALGDALLTGQCLHLLGEITVRRGGFEASEPLLARSRALLEAADAQAKVTLHKLFGLFVAARLFVRLGNGERAAELAGLLLRHPAAECAVCAELPALRAELAAHSEALERGGALALDSVVDTVLAELANT